MIFISAYHTAKSHVQISCVLVLPGGFRSKLCELKQIPVNNVSVIYDTGTQHCSTDQMVQKVLNDAIDGEGRDDGAG